MKELTILFCSRPTAELLKVSVSSLLRNSTSNFEIKILLNGACKDSEDFLRSKNIRYKVAEKNLGFNAVDYFMDEIDSEFVCLTADDILYCRGWDSFLIERATKDPPLMACATQIQSINAFRGAFYDKIGDILDPKTSEQLELNYSLGKYDFKDKNGYYVHPILVKTEDYLKVGGFRLDSAHIFYDGVGVEEYFPYKLKQLNPKYKFVGVGASVCYHYGGFTTERLSRKIFYNSTGEERFYTMTGMTIKQFKMKIQLEGQSYD